MRRYPEVDALRTLAILMMVVYHAVFDLSVFYDWNVDAEAGAWRLLAICTASLFLFLVGVSSRLLWQFARDRNISEYDIACRLMRRGAIVFGCGMGITCFTYIIQPETYIRFGILHLIGVSLLLCAVCVRYGKILLLASVPILAMGMLVGPANDPSPLLLPFGIYDFGFRTWDYFPLIPWFGVVLIGIGTSALVYGRKTSLSNEESQLRKYFDSLFHLPWAQWMLVPGRQSLLIYLVHQLILLGMLSLALGAPQL